MIAIEILDRGLREACKILLEDVKHVPVRFWNESVFRYQLIRQIYSHEPEAVHDIEWKRWDFVLQEVKQNGGKQFIPIEIKFWCHCGDRNPQRGGPSSQNVAEFEQVLGKLQGARKCPALLKAKMDIKQAFLILVYADPIEPGIKRTFGRDYDDLSRWNSQFGLNTRVIHERVPCEPKSGEQKRATQLTCKLIEVQLNEI